MKATMKALHRTLTASAVAFSAFAFIALAAPCARAQPMRSGTYCLSYGEGGTDCSFTSYAQCEATASGLTAECFGPTVQDPRRHPRSAGQTGAHRY